MQPELNSSPLIALNLLYLLPGKVGGTETYAAGLIRGLAEVAPQVRFLVLVNRAAAEWPLPATGGFTRMVCDVAGSSRARRYHFEQIRLPGVLRRAGVDVVHSLGYVSPLISHCPRVVSIHDLHYLAYGDRATWPRRKALALLVRASGRRADAILTMSEFSRGQVLEHLGVSSERVVVVPGAGDCQPGSASGSWRPVETPYLLAFGSSAPNKNLPRLLAAYSASRPAQRLVIVGHVPESVRQGGEEIGVVFTGYLEKEQMLSTLRQADFLIFPSTYEGFGLPVLEAMSAGVPVLCSTAAALPEVAGDAACYFDPLDVSDMAAKMRGLAESETQRRELIRRGKARAARYSWRSSASQTMAVYHRVAAAVGRLRQ
jgi:glycosyltransferase involved in cell wall biosynthesis